MKNLCLSFIIFNLLLAQCDNASEYVCQLNPACEWFSETKEGECSDLNQLECQSARYNYCYWNYGYGGQGECAGGDYTMVNGYCIESQNIINEYIDERVDEALIKILLDNGFEKFELNNETLFKIGNRRETLTFSYSDIHTKSNGIEFINPKIQFDNKIFKSHPSPKDLYDAAEEEGKNCEDTDNTARDRDGDDCRSYSGNPDWCGNYNDDDFNSMTMCCACGGGIKSDDAKYDKRDNLKEKEYYNTNTILMTESASINLSFKQLIYLLEQAIYHEELGKITDFDIHFENIYLSHNTDHPWEDFSTVEVSIEDIKIMFDGYLNQKILDDIDRQMRIPNMNQSFEVSVEGFQIDKVLGSQEEDFLKDPLNMISPILAEYSNDIFRLDLVNIKGGYLPQNNKLEFSFDLKHPFIKVNTLSSVDVLFDLTNPDKSILNSAHLEQEIGFNFPKHINIMLDRRIIEEMDRENIPIRPTRLPNEMNLSMKIDYNDLQELLNAINRGESPNFDMNAIFNLSASLGNMAFDIADTETFRNGPRGIEWEKVFFSNVDVSSLSANFNLQRNNINVKSELYTNLFKGKLNGDVDIYDPENPWINKLDLNIYNINDIVMDYIKIIEEEGRFKIETNPYSNDINISVYGNLKNPQIQGIGPADR